MRRFFTDDRIFVWHGSHELCGHRYIKALTNVGKRFRRRLERLIQVNPTYAQAQARTTIEPNQRKADNISLLNAEKFRQIFVMPEKGEAERARISLR